MAASPQHVTLVAATVSTLTFDEDFPQFEITNVDGAAPVYFRFDGVAPTVGGAGCYVVPATITSVRRKPKTSGNSVVKLISSGTPKVAVRGLRSDDI
jgi:hypothetical protein